MMRQILGQTNRHENAFMNRQPKLDLEAEESRFVTIDTYVIVISRPK